MPKSRAARRSELAPGRRCRLRWSLVFRSRPWDPSGDQFVSAGLRDQYLRNRGILLDLLAQPINVGLQSVSRYAGIVSPHFLQQDFARYGTLTGALKET